MDQKGFSLLEVLTVIVLMAIIIAIVSRSGTSVNNDRLNAASHQLYADLQTLKQNAIMQPTVATSRGFGIRFTSSNSYVTFEFDDANNDFTYVTSEERNRKQQSFPMQLTTTIGDAGDPTGASNALLFDRRGVSRIWDWSGLAGGVRTYVLRMPAVSQARCVQVDGVSVREGFWNGANCN